MQRRDNSLGEARGQRNHVIECLIGEDLAQSRAHGRRRQDIARERAADPAYIDEIGIGMLLDHFCDALRDAIGTRGDTATDALADDKDVGVEVPGPRASARARRDRVRFVDEQQGAVLAAELSDPLEESRLGQDDADVGERRLGDEHGDVAVSECPLHGVQVVELHRPGRVGDR